MSGISQKGLIGIKVFRKGSQAALKLVYPITRNSLVTDDLKADLASQILGTRYEKDFDFMEIFQFIPDGEKKAEYEKFSKKYLLEDKTLLELMRSAEDHIFIFSGNLSIFGVYDDKGNMADVIGNLVGKGVNIKIIARVDIASVSNIKKISHLMLKHPERLEIRHRYQPLRGIIIDGRICRFKNDENIKDYKRGELKYNTRIFYEVHDREWLAWLEKLFWAMYNTGISYADRIKEINGIFRSIS